MFIEDNKEVAEQKLLKSVEDMMKEFCFQNWTEVHVFIEFYDSSYSGSFIICDDSSFIDSTELFMFTSIDRSGAADLGEEFAEIFTFAFDFNNVDKNNPLNIVTLKINNQRQYSFQYFENLSDYKYAGTPLAIWQYNTVGYKDYNLWHREADILIKKYNIEPERVLTPKIFMIDFEILIKNILSKNIYEIFTFLPKNSSKIYFHLDKIGGNLKFNVYIKDKNGSWIEEHDIRSTTLNVVNRSLIATYREWIKEFDAMHKICKKVEYIALDYVYDMNSGELSYTYDNTTADTFDDDLALTKEWEQEYFYSNTMNTMRNKDSLITGSIVIDATKFIQEEVEKEDIMEVLVKEFKGDDIHDLIPQYLQNNYEIIAPILPAGFTKIYFYTEDDGYVSRQMGYVVVDGKHISLSDLAEYDMVSEPLLAHTIKQLAMWSNYFRSAFIACGLEPWTVFTYSLDSDGKISTNFKYLSLETQKYPNEIFDSWLEEEVGYAPSEIREKQ